MAGDRAALPLGGSMAKLYESDNDGADGKEMGAKSNELLAG